MRFLLEARRKAMANWKLSAIVYAFTAVLVVGAATVAVMYPEVYKTFQSP
jgi:hypothetical protein